MQLSGRHTGLVPHCDNNGSGKHFTEKHRDVFRKHGVLRTRKVRSILKNNQFNVMKIKIFGRYLIDVSQETPTLGNVGTVHVLLGFVSRSTMHLDKSVMKVFKETPSFKN